MSGKKKTIKITSKKKQTKPVKKKQVKKAIKSKSKVKNSEKTRKTTKKAELTGKAKGYANLIPGANKNGRPKGILNFKTRLAMAVDKLAEEFVKQHNKKHKKSNHIKKEDVDIMGDIFAQYVNKARSGDLKAMDSLLDRAYGKASQPVKHEGSISNESIEEQEKRKKEADKEIESWEMMWTK